MIGLRAVTLLGAMLGLLGTVVLAAAVQGLAISATLWPETQGLLLTVLAVGTLVLAMLLLPAVQRNMAVAKPAAPAANGR